MGNSPSSPLDSNQLHRNTSSSSNSGAKFTMVYQDTPAIVFRPDSFQEALDQARHTFQIPRYQPVEFSYKYLSVGFVALNEHNWDAVIPTIHTLFITTQPPPPSTGSSPYMPDSRRLSPAPLSDSEISHDLSEHSQSTEASNVIPPSPLDPRVQVQHSYLTAPTTAAVESVNSHPRELTLSIPAAPETLLQPSRTPLTPIRSPLGKKPLPTPPAGRPSSLPQLPRTLPIPTSPPAPQPPPQPPAFSPPSISPHPDPSIVTFLIYHDDSSARYGLPEYRILHLLKTRTIADLKDVLSEEFIVPAYLQELWIGGRLLGDQGDQQVLEEAGITHGVVVVLSRSRVGENV